MSAASESKTITGLKPATLAGRRPSADFGSGRICAEPVCVVRLSRYNPDENCGVHEPKDITPIKAPRKAPRGSRRRK